jgi:glucose-1-phosphate adenylyltransferase
MDYEYMLQQHVDDEADVTVGCVEIPGAQASSFGVMQVDARNRITAFVEKPANPPTLPGRPDIALASMGIYVFETKCLIEQLRRDAADPASTRDFGRDIIPYMVRHGHAVAHEFKRSCVRTYNAREAYWRDVGSLDAYFAANIDLTESQPGLDLFDRDWPIWTYAEITPPARFVPDGQGRRGIADACLIAGGTVVTGASLCRSLVFTGVRAHSGAEIEEAVILPYAEIGQGARLRRVVIDSGVRIPDGLVVGEDAEFDAQRFRRTDGGVCLITQPMIDMLLA